MALTQAERDRLTRLEEQLKSLRSENSRREKHFDTKLDDLKKSIDELKKTVADGYVKKETIAPVTRIVYAIGTAIILMFVYAVGSFIGWKK